MITMPPKKYVLNLQKRGLREMIIQLPPRKRPSKTKNKQALRAGVLSRMVQKILNKKLSK